MNKIEIKREKIANIPLYIYVNKYVRFAILSILNLSIYCWFLLFYNASRKYRIKLDLYPAISSLINWYIISWEKLNSLTNIARCVDFVRILLTLLFFSFILICSICFSLFLDINFFYFRFDLFSLYNELFWFILIYFYFFATDYIFHYFDYCLSLIYGVNCLPMFKI